MATPGMCDYLHDAAWQATKARTEIERTRAELKRALDRADEGTLLCSTIKNWLAVLDRRRDEWQTLVENLHELAKGAGPRESLVAGRRES